MYSQRNPQYSGEDIFIDDYSSLPKALYSAQAVREMDRIAIEDHNIDGFELMTKAARFSFHSLIKQWPDTQNLIILCGSGNNAGDGYIVAALAKKRSWNVNVFFASSPEKLTGAALQAYQECIRSKVNCESFNLDRFDKLCKSRNLVIVDALLGTGLNSDVKGIYADMIGAANLVNIPKMAIDIPSGLSANTGQVLGVALEADLTASFIGLKLGLFTGSGRQYSGKIVFSQLDLEDNFFEHIEAAANILDLDILLRALPMRQRNAHKGSCGHTMIIGGDIAYGGAVILAAMASTRMGSGLTTVLTQEAHRSALLTSIPEAMVFCSQSMQDIEQILTKANVIIIGPGLGKSAWSEKLLLAAINSGKPLVIDADALNILSNQFLSASEFELFKLNNHVFTPHPGEAARMLQLSSEEVQFDRLNTVKALQNKWGGSILLKGSGSLICSKDNKLTLCPYGNPGMASGGMGDVLSGLVGGLIAQGLQQDYALQLAVCLHAKAADIASKQCGERGLLASDLIPIARRLLNNTL